MGHPGIECTVHCIFVLTYSKKVFILKNVPTFLDIYLLMIIIVSKKRDGLF